MRRLPLLRQPPPFTVRHDDLRCSTDPGDPTNSGFFFLFFSVSQYLLHFWSTASSEVEISEADSINLLNQGTEQGTRESGRLGP